LSCFDEFQAWKQSKLEVAEHMYRKLDNSQLSADPAAAEELVDALYEIGKDQYAKKQIEVAVRWLGRAHDVLSEQELERLSDTSTDLRLSTMHLLTKSHLALDTPESVAKAQDLVELMEADYGDKLLVSLLRLEILSTQAQPDADVYYGVLLRMFRSIILTRSNFKTVMHHLHKLRKISPDLACKALDDLLHLRLFESEKEEWVEKAAMMRIWITTSSPVEGSRPLLDSLGDFLDDVSNNTKVSFTPAATHAAQTLIWKVIETNYEQKCFESTEKLCRLSSHPLFDKCGEGNKAKLVRKIIQSALARQDFVCAREAFFSMSEAGQASPQSRFLLYKVALRTGDNELGEHSRLEAGFAHVLLEIQLANVLMLSVKAHQRTRLCSMPACLRHSKLGIKDRQSLLCRRFWTSISTQHQMVCIYLHF
jgi:hypothetical protein